MGIYGMIIDEAVQDETARSHDLGGSTLNCGIIDRELIEFFVEPVEFVDNRAGRYLIDYRASSYINLPAHPGYIDVGSVIQGQNVLIQYPDESITYGTYDEVADDAAYGAEAGLPGVPTALTGKLSFILDNDQFTGAESAAINAFTDADYANIYNIIEYLLYGTIPTDLDADIETNLRAGSGGDFDNYINDSYLETYKSTVELFGGINAHRFSPRSISFGYQAGATALTFNLWFDRNDLRYKYPVRTITKVIPPLIPTDLLDPSALTVPLAAINVSEVLNATTLAHDITNIDHSGYVGFTTRYTYNGNDNLFTFGILFRGVHPSVFDVRASVIDYLLNCGEGDETIWRTRFPDLFVDNRFYMVPIWNNITVLPGNDVYPSISSNKAEDAIVTSLMSNLVADSEEYDNVTVAYDKFFVASLADDGNGSMSLLDEHPTYQDYTSTEPNFETMAETAQAFSFQLNQILAVASGEINNVSYAEVVLDNKIFLSFILDDIEYLIMTKDSYFTNLP